MQVIASDKNQWVLNFARGEELMQALLEWCKKENIAGATLAGLGAADQLELAYYNLTTKSYERHTINEEVEILSLIGNLGTLKEEKILHIHGVFGRRDLSTFGGHVFNLRISGAGEIRLRTMEAQLSRAHDEATGLNLLCKAG